MLLLLLLLLLLLMLSQVRKVQNKKDENKKRKILEEKKNKSIKREKLERVGLLAMMLSTPEDRIPSTRFLPSAPPLYSFGKRMQRLQKATEAAGGCAGDCQETAEG